MQGHSTGCRCHVRVQSYIRVGDKVLGSGPGRGFLVLFSGGRQFDRPSKPSFRGEYMFRRCCGNRASGTAMRERHRLMRHARDRPFGGWSSSAEVDSPCLSHPRPTSTQCACVDRSAIHQPSDPNQYTTSSHLDDLIPIETNFLLKDHSAQPTAPKHNTLNNHNFFNPPNLSQFFGMSFSFCLKASSSSVLAVFIVC